MFFLHLFSLQAFWGKESLSICQHLTQQSPSSVGDPFAAIIYT